MMSQKLLAQMNLRLCDVTMAEIDRYLEERIRETRVPLSRAHAVREILNDWAEERIAHARLRKAAY